MARALTTKDLFDAQRGPLKLGWVAGRSGGNRLFESATAKFPGLALVGHLNFVHPEFMQKQRAVIGRSTRR